jgi:acetyl esterase/lipase
MVLTAVMFLAPRSCRAAPLDEGAAESAGKPEIVEVRGMAYVADGNPRHELDLYLPKGKKRFPVLFLVHGGGWIAGSKETFLGVFSYADVGRCFARHGIATVMPNHRLSPKVQHPAHIEDVAKAFAWTCRHIGKYGGRADQVFVAGHSAGGHLVSLLATDQQYLRREGLAADTIKGVASVSGVYRLDPLRVEATGAPNGKAEVDPYALAFGKDTAVRKAASPLTHVRPGLPPFLIVYAMPLDLPTLPEMARDFAAALRASKCEVEVLVVPSSNHASIMFHATRGDDPVVRAVLQFISRNCEGSAPRS